jgi:adenylate kinase family enzyme
MRWFKKLAKHNPGVLAHIAGPSGSGKTTLINRLSKSLPHLNFKDLDEFDDQAEESLGFDDVMKKDFSDQMILDLFQRRQELLDQYIQDSDKPIVLAGHHWEGKHILDIPTENRFLLDVDAETSAIRALKRSQSEDVKYRRTKEELPGDIKEAQEDIDLLKKHGYEPMSPKKITKWLEQA